MDTESQASSASGRSDSRRRSSELGSERELLLNEARTTTNQQLGQINKVDDQAVRTVRIGFVLLGVLAGGAQFQLLPPFGLLAIVGTVSLVGSLVVALFVYGTSRLFIGPQLDRIADDNSEKRDAGDSVTETHVKVVEQYESGITWNRRVLYSNASILGFARLLLALAVVFLVLTVPLHGTA